MTETAAIPLTKLQEDLNLALKAWRDTDSETSPPDYLQLFQQVRLSGAGSPLALTETFLLREVAR